MKSRSLKRRTKRQTVEKYERKENLGSIQEIVHLTYIWEFQREKMRWVGRGGIIKERHFPRTERSVFLD